MLRLRAIGYGARGVDVDHGAGAQRLLAIVARLRLDAVESALRRQRTRGKCRTGQQAAAAQRNEQRIEVADLVEQFSGSGALP